MKLPKTLIKLLSLIVCAVLALAAFRIENAQYPWETGVLDVCYSFLVIPALFAVWLVAVCRVRAAWWRWLVFAASYAAWFCLSYFLWLCLNDFLLGGFYGIRHFFIVWELLVSTDALYSSENVLFYACFFITLVLCAVGVYALFVAENIAVKKLLGLSFKKADWILLFAHPVLVALFALPAHLAVILAEYGADCLKWLWDIDTYFFQGTVIAGYLMTEGVLFIRGMNGAKSA